MFRLAFFVLSLNASFQAPMYKLSAIPSLTMLLKCNWDWKEKYQKFGILHEYWICMVKIDFKVNKSLQNFHILWLNFWLRFISFAWVNDNKYLTIATLILVSEYCLEVGFLKVTVIFKSLGMCHQYNTRDVKPLRSKLAPSLKYKVVDAISCLPEASQGT